MILEENKDCYILDDKAKVLIVVYFNPDGNDGEGHIVVDYYGYEFLREYMKEHGEETLYESASSCSKQYIIDDLSKEKEILCHGYLAVDKDTKIKKIVEMIEK